MSPSVTDLTKEKTGYVLVNGNMLKNVPPQSKILKVQEGYCKDIQSPIVDFSDYGLSNMEFLIIEKNCFTTCNNLVFSSMLLVR